MLIPFPGDDEPRRRIADFLREAQRLLGGSEMRRGRDADVRSD
jgi:hypothetical protein